MSKWPSTILRRDAIVYITNEHAFAAANATAKLTNEISKGFAHTHASIITSILSVNVQKRVRITSPTKRNAIEKRMSGVNDRKTEPGKPPICAAGKFEKPRANVSNGTIWQMAFKPVGL